MSHSINNDFFKSLKVASKDPILGLNEDYNADSRAHKVNLGVGVYYNDHGEIPLLEAVKEAEFAYFKSLPSRGYLPIDGFSEYNKNTQSLLFGENSNLVKQNRVLTAQTLGGTGALKIGADFLKQLFPYSKVLISDPSWENHQALFERAGFSVATYPYYNYTSHSLDFEKMVSSLKKATAGSIVVLHACCHNPTGVDPTFEEWKEIINTIRENGLIPFLDIAYQGFGKDLDSDSSVVRMFSESDGPTLISSSFSKSFALYGERVGALTVVTNSEEERKKVLGNLKRIIRTSYSNPPVHGSAIVSSILKDFKLFLLWKKELDNMKNRIQMMRKLLVEKLEKNHEIGKFNFIKKQKGMFSYSGLNLSEVNLLKEKHGIYIVPNGRICIAALNKNNIDRVAKGICSVMIEK